MLVMRRFRAGVVATVAALAFVGFCSSEASLAQTTIKVGHDQPDHSPHHQAALKWKELVEARSNGKLKVTIFPSMLLGSGTQMVEQVQAGALEVAILPSGWVAPLVPGVQVLDLPFLFPNREVLYKVVDGPVGAEILKPLNKVNIEGVAYWESGFKQFTGHFPISKPADYSGKKIRTMPAPVIQEQFKAFGAVPTSIDFKELYSALQQKIVDGQENPLATIAANRFFEVQKYLTLSDHGFLAYVFMINKPFLEKLPADQRKILIDAAIEAGKYQRQLIADAEKKHIENFAKSGVQITPLDKEARAAFEQASRSVHEWFAQKYGRETLDLIRAEIAKNQKN